MARRMAKRRDPSAHPADSARGATLVIDVLVGVPSKCGPMATFPEILKGIHKRAEIEIRERPELGQVMIGVYHCQAPAEFHPKPARGGPPGEGPQQGPSLIYPFEEEAVSAVAQGSMAISVLATYERLGIDSIDTDDAKAVSVLVRPPAQGGGPPPDRLPFLAVSGLVRLGCAPPRRLHWVAEGPFPGGRRRLGAQCPAIGDDAGPRRDRRCGCRASPVLGSHGVGLRGGPPGLHPHRRPAGTRVAGARGRVGDRLRRDRAACRHAAGRLDARPSRAHRLLGPHPDDQPPGLPLLTPEKDLLRYSACPWRHHSSSAPGG